MIDDPSAPQSGGVGSIPVKSGTDRTTTPIPTTPRHAEQYLGTATGTVRRAGYVPTQHSRTGLVREERIRGQPIRRTIENISREGVDNHVAGLGLAARGPGVESR
jgi:hypothetical protein